MAEKEMQMAKKIAEAAKAAGGCAYFVGGYVRDLLMGEVGKDIDIEVHGLTPDALKGILDSLGERLDIGESFGIFGLRGYDIDIAMPRKEECRGRGHRDFDVFVDPHIGTMGAARRRDFTVNAMMADVLSGEIIDHYGGRCDLENKIIRHVDEKSFAEDPLRVLRGCQFAARFEFEIAEETIALCRDMDISTLPRERIMGELEKALLKAARPSIFFEQLRRMDQLEVWFPELEALIGLPQNEKYHMEGDVWVHTMMVLDQAAKLREYTADPLAFMMSALCHDFGKAVATEVVNGELHAYDHEIKGLPIIENFLKRITGEVALRKYVLNMAELHMKPNMMAAQGSSVKSTNRMLDQSVDPEGLLCLAIADGLGKISPRPYVSHNDFFRERLSIYKEYMSRPQVSGRDLIDSGLMPDKSFSDYLAYAHKLHLAGVEKDSALKQTLAYARSNKTNKSNQ